MLRTLLLQRASSQLCAPHVLYVRCPITTSCPGNGRKHQRPRPRPLSCRSVGRSSHIIGFRVLHSASYSSASVRSAPRLSCAAISTNSFAWDSTATARELYYSSLWWGAYWIRSEKASAAHFGYYDRRLHGRIGKNRKYLKLHQSPSTRTNEKPRE